MTSSVTAHDLKTKNILIHESRIKALYYIYGETLFPLSIVMVDFLFYDIFFKLKLRNFFQEQFMELSPFALKGVSAVDVLLQVSCRVRYTLANIL